MSTKPAAKKNKIGDVWFYRGWELGRTRGGNYSAKKDGEEIVTAWRYGCQMEIDKLIDGK